MDLWLREFIILFFLDILGSSTRCTKSMWVVVFILIYEDPIDAWSELCEGCSPSIILLKRETSWLKDVRHVVPTQPLPPQYTHFIQDIFLLASIFSTPFPNKIFWWQSRGFFAVIGCLWVVKASFSITKTMFEIWYDYKVFYTIGFSFFFASDCLHGSKLDTLLLRYKVKRWVFPFVLITVFYTV